VKKAERGDQQAQRCRDGYATHPGNHCLLS
jgi:hypothetical protein